MATFDDERAAETVLVERLLAGDERAFEQLADDYFPRLLRFAMGRLSGDQELATELVQVTVCKVVTRLDSFRGESSLHTWLCACCRNEIRMYYRSRGRQPSQVEIDDEEAAIEPLPSTSDGPERSVLRREAASLVHQALDELPARYARALEWKYLHEIPVVEIASRLEITPKAAESLLSRARRSFESRYDRLGSRPLRALDDAPTGSLS